MSNETQVKTEQNGALNKLKAEFGQVNLSDGNEQKKAAALSFSGGGLYIGLKLNSKTNPRTGAIEESPASPRSTARTTISTSRSTESGGRSSPTSR